MPRGWMDSPIFLSPLRDPFSRRDAWIWLIEHAAFARTTTSFLGKTIRLERGQLSVSIRDMVGAWGWNTTKVHRFIQALQAAQMTVTETETGRMLITVCNYSALQDGEKIIETPIGTPPEHPAQVTGTGRKQREQLTTSPKEGEDGSLRTRAKRGMRVDAWGPDEDDYQFAENLGLPAQRTIEEFRDYWIAIPGQRGLKLDWKATFRNRCRELSQRKSGGINGHRPQIDRNQQKRDELNHNLSLLGVAPIVAGGLAGNGSGSGLGGGGGTVINGVSHRVDPGDEGGGQGVNGAAPRPLRRAPEF